MTDLLAAIEAAIAEDERAASAFRNDLGDVRAWRCDDVGGKVRDAGPMPFVLPDVVSESPTHLHAAHIARHGPARVLRQAQAQRRILAEHQLLTASSDLFRDGSGGLGDCACCRYPWPCDTVRALADGYGIEVT